jgi:hypothetical protein
MPIRKLTVAPATRRGELTADGPLHWISNGASAIGTIEVAKLALSRLQKKDRRPAESAGRLS